VRIIVLGSGAGGGVPQWNCACAGCEAARNGYIPPRSEACVAIAAGDGGPGEPWLLLGAPATAATLVARHPAIRPRPNGRSRIGAILLCNGDLDQTLGLLSLREGDSLHVLSTEAVKRGFLDENRLARTLERSPDQLRWRAVAPGERLACLAFELAALAVPGKVPLHLGDTVSPSAEDNVAWTVRCNGKLVAFAPSVAAPTPAVSGLLDEADVVFFDGTFWFADELRRAGRGERGARDMGHWPLGGPEGSLEALERARGRRILVHINNTNPVLLPDSAERSLVERAGVEVAHDGMEIVA
jgi:pyrroloquinoline quinone biosynthesis protein B